MAVKKFFEIAAAGANFSTADFLLGVQGGTTDVLFSKAQVVGPPLTLASGTITSNIPALTITQTWNNSAVQFTAFKIDITNTASLFSANEVVQWKVNGSPIFSINEIGDATFFRYVTASGGAFSGSLYTGLGFLSLSGAGWADQARLEYDGASRGAMRSSSGGATAFSIYNTYTDASNYERGVFDWQTTANVLTIGTQKAGTGVARQIQFSSGNANAKLTLDLTTDYTIALKAASGSTDFYLVPAYDGAVYVCGGGATGNNALGIKPPLNATSGVSISQHPAWSGNFAFGFLSEGAYDATPLAEVIIQGLNQHAANLTALAGGPVRIKAGYGASSASGAAHGGAIYLDGGRGYGTGVDGNIIVGNAYGKLDVKTGIVAKTKAGAFAAGDVPAGTFMVGRDTSGSTTKLYYNNAGTLQSVALT